MHQRWSLFLQVRQTLDAQKLKRCQGLEFCSGIARRGMALVCAQLKLPDLVGLRVEVQCLEIPPEGMERGADSKIHNLRWCSDTVLQEGEILGCSRLSVS